VAIDPEKDPGRTGFETNVVISGAFHVHAAAFIFASALLAMIIWLLLPLGVHTVRRLTPPGSGEAPLAPAVVPAFSSRARSRPAAILAATGHMRAPPTFTPPTCDRFPDFPSPE
jgi:hypothetical protein